MCKQASFVCNHQCLATCNARTASYCIAEALVASYRGNMEHGYAMCGSEAWRIDKIVSVKELIGELVAEATAALNQS